MSHGLAVSWDQLKSKMDSYRRENPVDEDLYGLYEEIFRVWYRIAEKVSLELPLNAGEIKEALRQGRYLLSENPLPVDAALYREALEEVVGAAVRHGGAQELSKVLALPDLQKERLALFLAESAVMDGEKMQQYVTERGWDEQSGAEAAVIAFFLYAALTPFYLTASRAFSTRTDFSLWREGYCPVCGQKPSMAKLRGEDGARLLECRLCHTQWQFPRLECPFCRNNDFNLMQFFYTDEYPGRRVQLCERCKSYLKTVVLKEIGHDVILELENIFTIQLDLLARREGYRPGEDLALLV